MLNALRYTRVLENAGFTEEQAKAAVDCWMEFMSAEFATKGDLKELEYTTRSALKDLEYNVNKRLDQVDIKLEQIDQKFDQIDQKLEKHELKLTIKLGVIMLSGITVVQFLPAILNLIR